MKYRYSVFLIFTAVLFFNTVVVHGQKQNVEKGFTSLFDGTSMDSWVGNTKEYVLEEGNIVMRPSQEMGGNLYTKEKFDDFILRFEFLLTAGANNGLGIRHDMVANDQGYSGMELQILDNNDLQYKDLKPYQYHGSLYGIAAAKRNFPLKVGDWNTEEVIAKGDHLIIKVNGVEILNTHIDQAVKNLPVDSYSKAILNKKGHIAFLGHGTVVKFRNIRIKPLRK